MGWRDSLSETAIRTLSVLFVQQYRVCCSLEQLSNLKTNLYEGDEICLVAMLRVVLVWQNETECGRFVGVTQSAQEVACMTRRAAASAHVQHAEQQPQLTAQTELRVTEVRENCVPQRF